MAQKLAVIRVIIFRENREFLRLTQIVKHGSREQQVAVEQRIVACVIVAQLDNAQCMFQKAAHKSVMDALGRRVELKRLCKSFVFHEEAFCQFSIIWCPDGFDKSGQFLIHLTDVFGGHREIVSFSDTLHIQLVEILEHGHIRVNIDVVHGLEIPYSRRI